MTAAKKNLSSKVDSNFSFFNETKTKIPRLVFLALKNAILGEKYELSVVIVGKSKMRELNKRWRNEDKPTDILSFPLSKSEGEIYINPETAKKKAIEFDRPLDNFLLFLFIHGLVHLKGYDHGAIMESVETKFRKQFRI